MEEINNTENEKKKNELIKVIEDYPIEMLELNQIEEIEQLADLYINKHLANVNRERKVLSLNYQLNYLHPIRIITPIELLDYGN